jgi:RNA polymerase sigma factor for flagellar operon FliA
VTLTASADSVLRPPPTARTDSQGAAGLPGAAGPAISTEDLVLGHLPVVGYLVTELLGRVPRHVTREDLTGAGLVALVQAARAYRPETGVPFGQYARLRVRGALVDELRAQDWATRRVRRRSRMLDEVGDQMTGQLGRRPTEDELAAALGLSVAEVRELRTQERRAAVLSLDATPVHDDVMSTLAAPHDENPEEQLLRAERIDALRRAVSALPERQRTVIEGYDLGSSSMRELATVLNVTESRVSQIRSEALAGLRRVMDAHDGDAPAGGRRATPVAAPATPSGVPAPRRRPSVPATAPDAPVTAPDQASPPPPASPLAAALGRSGESTPGRHRRSQFMTFAADQSTSGPRTARVPQPLTEDQLS